MKGRPDSSPPPAAGVLSRARGCLLGQIAGDSLGSLVEFQGPDTIRRAYPNGVHRLAAGGVWGTLAGQPTNDSEMALALARVLDEAGCLRVRIDTHGGRFVEGLDTAASYAVLERHAPRAARAYRSESELRLLVGTGASAAAIFHVREALDAVGFDKVGIVESSGFDPAKCKLFASVGAPVDVIGAGSYLPEKWSETYAIADIVKYDGRPSVKVWPEFLLRSRSGK